MVSLLLSAEETIKSFFSDLTSALGFWGVFGIVAGIEVLFVIFFAIKSAFSYEARLRKSLDKLNTWLFSVRTINEGNIKRFNSLVKTGPKRLVYYWQQFILNREGGPKDYLTEENLIKKPLQTSSWANNVKNLSILTCVWAFLSIIIGFAVQSGSTNLTIQMVAFALFFPAVVLLIGVFAILVIRSTRASNLDEIYHLHHLFIRFIQNACAELPPYIDFNLLFTPKEIEKGNTHLREYYEERARRAKREFDEARANDIKYVEYNFDAVGVDGKLLLNRAMRESEKFINKKTKILSQIAQIETQKDTLRRNYENIQIDLQRKIQVSKENIKSLIEKQAATTSRIEAQLLKQQQDKEIAKQADLQKDYDQEESRYNNSKEELSKQIEDLNAELAKSMEEATSGMSSEYQTFFEKVMQNAYVFADQKVTGEKEGLRAEKDKCEDELVAVQTQVKHLLDENNILRGRLEGFDPKYKQRLKNKDGKYVNGVFVSKDGSFSDESGFFHDKDGKVYNPLGKLVSQDETPEERDEREAREIVENQIKQFGSFVEETKNEEPQTEPSSEVASMQNESAKTETQEIPQVQEVQEEPIQEVVQEQAKADIPQEARVESVNFEELFGGLNQASNEEVKAEEVKVSEEPKIEGFSFEDLFAQQNITQEQTNETEPIKAEPKIEEKIQPKVEEKAEPPVQPIETSPARRRGRPKKTIVGDASTVRRGRGRPKKTTSTPKETAPAKKRGRPRKTEVKPTSVSSTPKSSSKNISQTTPAKKRGRPRKSEVAEQDVDTLAKINQLIHEEEAKLKNMKSMISDQLDEAIEKASQSKIEEEREEILAQVESLQSQAIEAQRGGKVEEFSSINKQIEILINRLTELNKR